MTKPTHVDMTKGVYRRIYAGFIDGQKINRLSWMAEAWFWRLLVQADDYGNLKYHAPLMAVQASPRRPITPAECDSMVAEIIASGLAVAYSVNGDTYLHFNDFEELQPAGKNGRRIARFPIFTGQSTNMVNPGESGGIQNNPGESKIIRVCPGESCAPIPIPIPTPIPTPMPMPRPNGGGITDGANTPMDSICSAIEAGFVTEQGEPLAGAGEMYQARQRLDILLRDSWRTGTCADFAPQLVELVRSQKFASVSGAVRFIEAVCKRCRRDGCLPGDPMRGGKRLQIERESEPEVSDVWSKVK